MNEYFLQFILTYLYSYITCYNVYLYYSQQPWLSRVIQVILTFRYILMRMKFTNVCSCKFTTSCFSIPVWHCFGGGYGRCAPVLTIYLVSNANCLFARRFVRCKFSHKRRLLGSLSTNQISRKLLTQTRLFPLHIGLLKGILFYRFCIRTILSDRGSSLFKRAAITRSVSKLFIWTDRFNYFINKRNYH